MSNLKSTLTAFRVRVLYKILFTFLLVIIIPLLVLSLTITNILQNSAKRETQRNLASGITYIQSLIENEKSELQINAQSIIDDIAKNKHIIQNLNESSFTVSHFLEMKFPGLTIPPENELKDILQFYIYRYPVEVSLRTFEEIEQTLSVRTDILTDVVKEMKNMGRLSDDISTSQLVDGLSVYIVDKSIMDVQSRQLSIGLSAEIVQNYNLDYLKIFRALPIVQMDKQSGRTQLHRASNDIVNRKELLKDGSTRNYYFEEYLRSESALYLQDDHEFLEFLNNCFLQPNKSSKILLTKDGLVVLVGHYLPVVGNTYVFVAGRMISSETFSLLKESVMQDYSILEKVEDPNSVKIQRKMTTLYDGYGNSMSGKFLVQNYDQVLRLFDTAASENLNYLDFFSTTFYNHLSNTYHYYAHPLYDFEVGALQPTSASEQSQNQMQKPYAVLEALILADMPQETRNLQIYLTVMTIISLVLILIASFFINRSIIDPIRKLLHGINTLTEKVKNEERFEHIHVKTKDEISELAAAFNNMADNLQQAHSDLKIYNVHLEEMVEERTKELNAINEELNAQAKQTERELRVAQNVQIATTPQQPEYNIIPEIQVGAALKPMAKVSGDYFDIFKINDDHYGIVVADVSGHGLPSALITAMAKVSFSNESARYVDTKLVCEAVNKNLTKSLADVGFYLTAFFIIVDVKNKRFQYTNAGHHKALLLRSGSNEMKELDSLGFFIGSIVEAEYDCNYQDYQSGDRIYIYTDGIVEARNDQGDFFEEERLNEFILQNRSMDVQDFCNLLMEEVKTFYGNASPNDDRTILVLDVS
jgi:serine phosphatase RsbU (regulator of sigma subunit)